MPDAHKELDRQRNQHKQATVACTVPVTVSTDDYAQQNGDFMKNTSKHAINFTILTSSFLMLVLAGCSAHSPMIMKNTTDTEVVSSNSYASHQNKIFLTEESLPANSQAEVIANIGVGKVWYGNSKNVYESMATRARELGADAVVEIKTWKQPSGFSWFAPHGSGKAIKLQDQSILSKMKGEWE